MSSELCCHRCIYQIPEENEAILRPTGYMGISVGNTAVQFVRLIQKQAMGMIRTHEQ